MSTLIDLVDNSRTDKNTVHSYLDLYETLLVSRKNSANNVLEIGIYKGGSIKLWHDYFAKAQIYGVDIFNEKGVWNFLQKHEKPGFKEKDMWKNIKNNDRITLILSCDAYNKETFDKQFSHQKFDVIVDDGPHTLQSMKFFVSNYSKLLEDDGIMILEDIAQIEWIEELVSCVPEDLRKHVFTFDLRAKKNRFDDIVLVINRAVVNENKQMKQ